jgi:hypothetical protein
MKETKTARIAHGYTAVKRLELVHDPTAGAYSLLLELAQDESPFAPSVTVKFFDVSQLTIKNGAGGLSQFHLLVAEDISHRQLDRIKYLIRELENENISFACRRFRVEDNSK